MTFDLASSPDSPSATSSQELESGHTLFASLGGLTIGQFGRALAPANLSATQAAALGLLMSGTSGRRGSNSSRSASLQSSLESRLRARTASVGSTLFTLTWKQRATPSGLQICALRASARRTSVSDCGSWPTPAARDWKGATLERWGENARPLNEVAVLAGWPTPRAADTVNTNETPEQWAARESEMKAKNPNLGGLHKPLGIVAKMAGPARLTATGLLLTGSTAETASGGQLCPGHSRWLMGLPSVWDDCGVLGMQLLRRQPKPSSRRTSGR